MMAHQPEITDTDAIIMARLAIFYAYEEARAAAADVRDQVHQGVKLPGTADDPDRLVKALRKLDPRCLAPEGVQRSGNLLRRLKEGDSPSAAERRKIARAVTIVGQGRRPDLFLDNFVRSLARWWQAVTGELPPLTRNAAVRERRMADAPVHFLEFLAAARADAGGSAVGLPDLTSTARRVGEAIRADPGERR